LRHNKVISHAALHARPAALIWNHGITKGETNVDLLLYKKMLKNEVQSHLELGH